MAVQCTPMLSVNMVPMWESSHPSLRSGWGTRDRRGDNSHSPPFAPLRMGHPRMGGTRAWVRTCLGGATGRVIRHPGDGGRWLSEDFLSRSGNLGAHPETALRKCEAHVEGWETRSVVFGNLATGEVIPHPSLRCTQLRPKRHSFLAALARFHRALAQHDNV